MTVDHHHVENNKTYQALAVNSGIPQPPSINPYLKKKKAKRAFTAQDFVEGILKGNRAMLSQAVTLIESTLPEHHIIAQEVIEKCLPYTGDSIRVGITGVPGAGKSTFIDSLGMHLIKDHRKIAVLAIDPSSERTKGSILGDKTRMERLSVNDNVFIRPSPSAGSLGGVARKTRESIVLCEAAGYKTVLVETVGVGQSETAMHSMVDFFLLIQLAGTGDELQGIKRGIMEMADGITINKCDGTNVEKAKIARAQFANALHLFPMPESGWTVPVNTCSAYEDNNIDKVWDMIEEYIAFTKKNGFFEFKRSNQNKYWMYETINDELRANFYNDPRIASLQDNYEKLVNTNTMTSFAAATELLNLYYKK